MPLLLRLLLCLTLLANTAGGVWAAQAFGGAPATAMKMTAASPCHDAAPASHAGIEHAGHHTAMHGGGGHDTGCCSHAGCDCLQHCGTSINFPATLALAPLSSQDRATRDIPGRGLPRPYQPVRPPIA